MDLHEIERRLQFDDVTIRCQCVLKLINSVVSKKPKGSKITSSNAEIPELPLLLEKCGAECSATTNFIAEALVSLVARQILDFDYAVSMFLSATNSSQSINSSVHGLTKLLALQFEEESGIACNVKKQYSLLDLTHPLIKVLLNRSEAWPAVIQSFLDVLCSDKESDSRIELIEPVLKYVLFHPSPSEEQYLMKVSLCEKICWITDDISIKSQLFDLLFSALPWLQVDSATKVTKALSFILHLKRFILTQQKIRKFHIENLLLSVLALCHNCVQLGLNDSEALEAAQDLTNHLDKQDDPSITVNACLALLSVIIAESACSTTQKLIIIGRELLKSTSISPTVSGMAFFSLLQIMSEPKVISIVSSEKTKASVIEFQKELENSCRNPTQLLTNLGTRNEHFEAFTILTSNSMDSVFAAFEWDALSKNDKKKWLYCAKEQINYSDNISNFFLHLICSFFVSVNSDGELLQLSLEVLEMIAVKHPHKSTKLFPLLLYKYNSIKDPRHQLLTLEYMIKTATHKYAVTSVIAIVQMMAQHSTLKAQAIYFMVELWKKHDRCLSVLNELLSAKSVDKSLDTGINEVLTAQAAAIKEICTERPDQHGGEFLSLLSEILNIAVDEASTPAAALALDGVYVLCEAEVIDIRSTWKTLAPRLCKDKRSLISIRMYKLLSLVPAFNVKSFEFDKFMNEIISILWNQVSTASNSASTVKAIYKCLAKFPLENHTLKLLPREAKENLKLPASMAATPFEMSKSPEDVLNCIPGHCFIDLLKSINNKEILEGYAEFLGSLVQQEIVSLPRSIYHQRRNISRKKNASGPLTKVPGFLCSQFHANKFPCIQKNLAVGVLLSYEPPVELGKDGQPIKRSLAEQARFYQQVLEVMINEVNLEISEWRRCVLTPSAWGEFMERAFLCCEEGRRAELDMQQKHGHLKGTTDEIAVMKDTAWLWVRDQFMELIKITSKSKSSSLGNAVLAVSGLAKALDKYYDCLEDKVKAAVTECPQFTDHKVFQQQCVETILCAMNPKSKPSAKTKLFSWLLTHLSKPATNASYLVQACASASLGNIISGLSGADVTHVSRLYEVLVKNLSSHVSPVLTMYSGIGLGFFTRALCQAGYAQCGESHMSCILKVAEKIRSIVSKENDIISGQVLCLTILHSALSQNGNPAFCEFIKQVSDEFYKKLMNEDPSSIDFEIISICASCMMVSSASNGSVDIQNAVELMEWFNKKRIDTPQCEGTAISLGILVDSLQRLGHASCADMRSTLFKVWAQVAPSEKKPTLHRLAALNGLCAMFSAGAGLIQINSELSSGNTQDNLNDLVQFMLQLLEATRDNGLQCISSWQLGYLYSAHTCQQQDSTAVPVSYSYLNETSILKPLVNFISHIYENDNTVYYQHFIICLSALGQNFSRPLPPLNWVAFLSSIAQNTHDSEIMDMCLKIAMYQMCGSPSAVTFLGSHILPPAFHGLSKESRLFILENIPLLANSLPPAKLQQFLKSVVNPMSMNESFETEGIIAMQAIVEAAESPNCNKVAADSLYQSIRAIVGNLKANEISLKKHLHIVCKSLQCQPEEGLNSILDVTEGLEDLHSVVILCCGLIRIGKKPVSALRPLIDMAKQVSPSEKNKITTTVLYCFADCIINEDSDIKNPEKCLSFLMEIIGRTKIVADNQSKFEITPVKEVFNFFVDISLAVIVGCSGFEVLFPVLLKDNVSHESLIFRLPLALSTLLAKGKWNEKADTIMEWLMFLYQSKYVEDEDKYYIKSSFCLLRSSKEYAKSRWTILTAQ